MMTETQAVSITIFYRIISYTSDTSRFYNHNLPYNFLYQRHKPFLVPVQPAAFRHQRSQPARTGHNGGSPVVGNRKTAPGCHGNKGTVLHHNTESDQ